MKLVVWDLHGTLEQGNERSVIDISNLVLDQFNYHQRFSYDDNPVLYGLKWYEYFSWLLPDDSHARHLELQEACFELSETRPDLQCRWMQPTSHAILVLNAISEGHDQILISNTRPSSLAMFIKTLDYERFFSRSNAFAVDAHTAEARLTKADVLSKYLADTDRSYDELLIVGDSPSDMKLRDVSGGITYLYAHPGLDFRACDADFKIGDLREVLHRI
jgi:phosphoglycolate phosphatase-like HAD superfamily hydrolase